MASQFLVRLRTPVLAGLGVAALVVSLAPAAQAAPTIASVNATLTTLAKTNEALTEQYNRAGEEFKVTRREAATAAATAAQAVRTYQTARSQVRLAIADQYRGDGMDRTAALLTSTSSQAYLDRLAALQLLSARRTSVTIQLGVVKATADAAQVRSAALVADAARRRDALATQLFDLKKRQSRYTTLLARLTEQQRLTFLARVDNTGANANSAASTDAAQGSFGNVPAPSKAAAIAVRFALAQRGKPYQFAAAGPGSYDCSGLTLAAWRAAGVSLPHFAAWQYNYGHHVARNQLQPGDLVFFYSPIGHVALYIGNGLIVHAPTSGDVVRVVPLSNFESDYVGATRL